MGIDLIRPFGETATLNSVRTQIYEREARWLRLGSLAFPYKELMWGDKYSVHECMKKILRKIW